MDAFTSKLKAFFKLEGDAESQWAAKGQGRKLGAGATKGLGSNTGNGMPPMPRSSSARAPNVGASPPQMPRSASTRASMLAPDTVPEQAALPARASAPASSNSNLPYPRGPLNVRVELPSAKLPAAVAPPPQPLASPAERLCSMSTLSSATDALPNGQPLIPCRGRHMHATDVVQQAVLQSVVMANTPTGAECAMLGPHLAMRELQQHLDLDSPPHLRVAAGAMNTPTAAERTLGLAGAWQPELHQDFHFQQCLALIVSQEELMAKRCLTTLHRVLNNIVDNPAQAKYRTLRLSNASIQSNIVQVRGALEFLDAAGFLTMFQPAATASPPATHSILTHSQAHVMQGAAAASLDPVLPNEAATLIEGRASVAASEAGNWREQPAGSHISPTSALVAEAVAGVSADHSDNDNNSSLEQTAGAAQLSHCGSGRSSCNSVRYLAAADEEGGSHSPGCAVRVRRGSAGSTSMQRRVSGMITGAMPDAVSAELPSMDGASVMTAARPVSSDQHALAGLLVLPDDAPLHPLTVALHELGRVMRVMGVVDSIHATHSETHAQHGDVGHMLQHSSATVMYDVHDTSSCPKGAATAWSPLIDTAAHAPIPNPGPPLPSPSPCPSSSARSPPSQVATTNVEADTSLSGPPHVANLASEATMLSSAPRPVAADSSSSPSAAAMPKSVSKPVEQQPLHEAMAQQQPQVDRQTKVVLPVASDMHEDLPDWFFERTAAELKAEVKSLAHKRAAGELLATRGWRDRMAQMAAQQSGSKQGTTHAHATTTLRVRFPEGVYLQGCFAAWEPITAVFEWVTESLRYPDISYELVCPGARKPLQANGSVRQQPELWPAAVLDFRPLHGLGSAAGAQVPLLSDERLATTMVE